MNLQNMRNDITRLIDDIKYHSDSLTPHHQLPIIQLNIILAKMNKMIEKTIILKHHLETEMTEGRARNESPIEEAEDVTPTEELPENKSSQPATSTTEKTTKNDKKDVGEKLRSEPIPDLKAAIGIYERYLFANELFQGNLQAYEEAVNALNSFEDLEKATYYIEQGLMKEYKWDTENEFVVSFYTLVQRRYDKS